MSARQQLPGEAQPTQLASVTHNEIGQATQKTMGTGRLAQQVDYAYNIRGWLTQLNNPFQPGPGDLFNLSCATGCSGPAARRLRGPHR